jgi:type VI protein secretion system component Hcp
MGKDSGSASDNFMWFPQPGARISEKGAGSQIAGETTDNFFKTKGAFEVSNFKFKAQGDQAEKKDTGIYAGKAKFESCEVNKVVDCASTSLYKACCQATIFPSIMLAVRYAGGDQLVFLQYIFRFNQILGISWDGGSGEERPREVITFSFKAMGMQYIPQKPGGKQGVPLYWSWNTAAQTSEDLTISGIDAPPDFLVGTPKAP